MQVVSLALSQHLLHYSSLGAIPKKNGKWQTIMHLSALAGRSVNDGIHPNEFSLNESSVDDAVAICLHLDKGALMAKIDFKSTFHMIPVHCTDWDFLGMHWREQYYMDTCLLFGLHVAPFLFIEYAMAIEWIMTHNYQLCHLIHYLDDFSWLPLTNPFAGSASWTLFSRWLSS